MEGITEVTTRYGRMRVLDSDQWVSRSLRELGEYSEQEFRVMRMLIETIRSLRGPIDIVDAGAYIGDLTIPLSRYVRRVFAFEPQAGIRALLEENLELNKITNVEVLPYALGDKAEKVTYRSASTLLNPGGCQMADPEGDVSVDMVTLDELDINPAFIKADIEGMEIAMLAGGFKTLQRTRASLMLEVETITHPNVKTEEVVEALGYSTYRFDFPLYSPDNFNTAPNPFGRTVSHMLLAIPPVNA